MLQGCSLQAAFKEQLAAEITIVQAQTAAAHTARATNAASSHRGVGPVLTTAQRLGSVVYALLPPLQMSCHTWEHHWVVALSVLLRTPMQHSNLFFNALRLRGK